MNHQIIINNQIFEHVYMTAPIGIAIVSPIDGRWLRLNPAYCKMLGYEEEELLGTTIYEILHPDDFKYSHNYVFQTILDGTPIVELEKRYFHKDGYIVWGSVRISLTRNESTGNPQYFIVQAIDITEKKVTEAKINEQHDIFNLISDNAQDIIMYLMPDGIACYISPSMEKILGYKTEEKVGKKILNTYFNDLKQYTDNDVVTNKVRHKAGHYVWMETTLKAIRDHQGNVQRILGIGRDVTTRKEYQDDLAEAQRIARLCFWDWNILNKKLSFSEEWIQIYGHIPQGDWYDIFIATVHPEDRLEISNKLAEVVKGNTFDLEYRIVLPDNTIKYVCTRGKTIFDDNHRAIRVIGTVQDISERKIMEERLREQERKFRLISETSLDFITQHTADEDVIYKYASPASLSLLGYEPYEMIGNSAYDYIHPEDIQAVKEYLTANLRQMTVYTVAFRIRRKDGQYIWFESTGRFTSDDKKTKELIAVSRDITEKIEAEKVLKESSERYIQLQKSLDHFSKDLLGIMNISELEQRLVNEVMDMLGVNFVYMVELDRDNHVQKQIGKMDDTLLQEIKGQYDRSSPICEVQPFNEGHLIKVGEIRGMDHVMIIDQTLFLNAPEKVWLMTLTRYVNVLYDNFRVIEDLTGAIEKLASNQAIPAWLLRILFSFSENERKRLSQDLHDAALQQQIVFYQKLETLAANINTPEYLRRELSIISEGLLDIIYQIRLTCNELRPPMLKELGLIASLESLIETTQLRTDYEIVFDSTNFSAALNDDQLIGLYRIIQELLANAAKHSYADTVYLTLSSEPESVHLVYSDNGIGIQQFPEKSGEHMGIYGMKERVRSLGGKVRFEFAEMGLSVFVSIPLVDHQYDF